MVSVLEGPRGTAWAAALDEERKVRRSPCSRHPSGHCFLAPRVLVRAWGGCRTLPSIRGLRFSAVRERCSVPLLPRLLPVCWSLHALPIKPCGPWPWGASWGCVQVGRCPWRRMGQLGGRCSAGPPLPRLHPSLTLACPSRPQSNSPCSATLSGVSPAPGDVSEPTCHFLQ